MVKSVAFITAHNIDFTLSTSVASDQHVYNQQVKYHFDFFNVTHVLETDLTSLVIIYD